jgi:hypothetical protein
MKFDELDAMMRVFETAHDYLVIILIKDQLV